MTKVRWRIVLSACQLVLAAALFTLFEARKNEVDALEKMEDALQRPANIAEDGYVGWDLKECWDCPEPGDEYLYPVIQMNFPVWIATIPLTLISEQMYPNHTAGQIIFVMLTGIFWYRLGLAFDRMIVGAKPRRLRFPRTTRVLAYLASIILMVLALSLVAPPPVFLGVLGTIPLFLWLLVLSLASLRLAIRPQ